jgi:hypothetical protein
MNEHEHDILVIEPVVEELESKTAPSGLAALD